MATGAKEKRFLKALGDLFTGAEVEGDSGFVNLMSMKRAYFKSISPQLMERIDERAPQKDAAPREELFDKLHTFFKRYFCESGSIYFRHLPAFAKTYERVYQDGQDVALSWKTRMLYYVKSDVLVRSMPVALDSGDRGGGGSLTTSNTRKFYFDASGVEHKRSNEKRDFVFTFDRVKDEREGPVVHLTVAYSEQGRKTNVGDILKSAHKADVLLTEDQLEQAIGVFRRQTEADYFIHKDARGFLREQFDLWMHQYLFHEETVFPQERLRQLQALRDTAYDIINFIAQFEDELRRAWEKPKFVRGVNYVVTLDRLDADLLRKAAKHKGAAAQVEEWQKFEMVDKAFTMSAILNGRKGLTPKYRFLPLDTRHFKDLELEILDGLGNLDEALDGELVHSENWQALNTLRKRYHGKVQCIYIDPPFNQDKSDQFLYRTNYKDANWATLLENRLQLAREQLSGKGSIFVRCDYNGNWIVKCLLDDRFGEDNFRNEIAILKTNRIKTKGKKYLSWHETVFYYAKKAATVFFEHLTIQREQEEWRSIDKPGEVWKIIPEEWVHKHTPENIRYDKEGNPTSRARIILGKECVPPPRSRYPDQESIVEMEKNGLLKLDKNGTPKMKKPDTIPMTDDWTDLYGYATTTGFPTENAESVLSRVVRTSTRGGEIVSDFFLGSGTTTAVAHKLGRKWLGVEMGDHFNTVILRRMKQVLAYDKSGISREVKEYKGGGAFKYYSLEQYEETLKNSRYEDGEQLELDSEKSPFEQYVFFGDDKLAHVVKPQKNGKLRIDLHALYPDVDIAETLANALGKNIRKRTADSVAFEDGTVQKINPEKMTEEEQLDFIALLKPYLWWGE